MKIFNKTKCPLEILTPLIKAAGRSVGARINKVVITVTQAQFPRTKGQAFKGFVFRFPPSKKWWRVDGGIIDVMLPRIPLWIKSSPTQPIDAIPIAQDFYRTCQHEWAHIRDFQQHTFIKSPRTLSGRRARWCDRPCEISAENMVEDAKRIKNQDDCILNLAVWLDEQHKDKIKERN